MKIDLDELERKARAATGEHRWRAYRCRSAEDGAACGIKSEPFASEDQDAYQRGVVVDTNRDECHHAMSLVDAEHIAASDPAAVLALIARIRELEIALCEAGHVFAGMRPPPSPLQLISLLEKGAVLP